MRLGASQPGGHCWIQLQSLDLVLRIEVYFFAARKLCHALGHGQICIFVSISVFLIQSGWYLRWIWIGGSRFDCGLIMKHRSFDLWHCALSFDRRRKRLYFD